MMRHINSFYTPDNAVLVLAGNIDPNRAMEDINKYFGQIPKSKITVDEVTVREPAPIGATRFTVQEDIEPRIDLLFHTPGYPNSDLYALEIIEGVLSGRSGRLYKRLVVEEQLCTDVGASNSFKPHDGSFHIYAQLKSESDPVKVEKIIMEEIEKIVTAAPSEREITRITNEIRMSFAEGLKSLEKLSDRLARFERLGSWRDLLEYPDKILSVDKESVPATAAKYLKPQLGTWGFIVPKSQDASAPTNNQSGAGRKN
jgi:predicted Zn-dependent peptidase